MNEDTELKPELQPTGAVVSEHAAAAEPKENDSSATITEPKISPVKE